jgi:hypothetical protein
MEKAARIRTCTIGGLAISDSETSQHFAHAHAHDSAPQAHRMTSPPLAAAPLFKNSSLYDYLVDDRLRPVLRFRLLSADDACSWWLRLVTLRLRRPW